MKDIISIIFAAIVLSFLIVILPLFSILDRQDAMSYNVVLTETTDFIDEIRSNGFITLDSYTKYITSLASTGNSYKVELQTYKKLLVPAVDASGNVIENAYVQQKELYNVQDIAEFLENDNINDSVDESNIKDNVYLLNSSDEIYIRVYNTNTTPGNLMYNMFVSPKDTKVIDITYGGEVNEVNWQLYTKLKNEKIAYPSVNLSLPVNANNELNIKKLVEKEELRDIQCVTSDLADLFDGVYELCADTAQGELYKYVYNLEEDKNKTMRFAVELNDVEEIKVGDNEYITLTQFGAASAYNKSRYKEYIINNFIYLIGMTADIDIDLNTSNPYYAFTITLTNIDMSSFSNISTMASLAIMPGLGRNTERIPTTGTESVKVELTNKSQIKTVEIIGPYNWEKFLKDGIAENAKMSDYKVYKNEWVFFKIHYTGINTMPLDNVKELIKAFTYINSSNYTIEYYTSEEMKNDYGIEIETYCIIVKIKYHTIDTATNNYILVDQDWFTGMPEAKSKIFELKEDSAGPFKPTIIFEGALGDNDWYVSDVNVKVIDNGDRLNANSTVPEGSGVWYSTISYGGEEYKYDENEEIVISESKQHTVEAWTYDYIGQSSQKATEYLKIDKISPEEPKFNVTGTLENGWYTSEVSIEITPGEDYQSGVNRTTYEVKGIENIEETVGTTFTLTDTGIYTVVATTYDNAGNKTTNTQIVNIDRGEAPEISFEYISGVKHSEENEWYYTDVQIRVNIAFTGGITENRTTSFEIIGDAPVEKSTFEGTTKDIIMSENGIHTINVKTTTISGNSNEASYTIKIDKAAPREPEITVTGKQGENEWYIEDVKVKVVLNGDTGEKEGKGFSGELPFSYVLEQASGRVEKDNQPTGTEIVLSEEGINQLIITTKDVAGNQNIYENTIKIDKTAPTGAEFDIQGKEGNNNWYLSNIYVGYEGGDDAISGISSITITGIDNEDENDMSINADIIDSETGTIVEKKNIKGKEVTLTTKDNAGHVTEVKKTINIDVTAPGVPVINMPEGDLMPNDATIFMYNKPPTITITPGENPIGVGESGVGSTTYTVLKGGETYIAETVGTSFTIPDNGLYTVTATTYDIAGNYSQSSNSVIIQQGEAPDVKFEIISGEKHSKDNEWYYTSVKLKATVLVTDVDIHSTVAGIETLVPTQTELQNFENETEVLFEANGNHKIRITTTTWFNLQKQVEYSLKIDSISPNMPEVTVEGIEGNEGWYTSDVTLTTVLKGDNGGSGEQPYSYEIINDGKIIANGNNMESNSAITVTSEGINTVRIIAYDGAGNTTVVEKEIKIDKTLPNIPQLDIYGTEGSNGWYVSIPVDAIVNLQGDSGGSGIASFSYTIKVNDSIVDNGSNLSSGYNITINQEGTNILQVTVYDMAGNATTFEQIIKIDNTLPKEADVIVTGTKGNNDWYTSNVNAKITANEQDTITYRIENDGSLIKDSTIISNGETITINTEGNNILYVTTTDIAGNESVIEKEVKIDKTSPSTPELTIYGKEGKDGWYTDFVEILLNYKEEAKASGIKDCTYSIVTNGETIISDAIIENDGYITFDTQGNNIITITLTDNAGNATRLEKEIKIDNSNPTAPTIHLPVEIDHNFGPTVHVYNTDINVTITPGQDILTATESGVEKTTYMLNLEGADYVYETTGTAFAITESGTYTIIARTYDNVGNYSETTAIVIIQKEPPIELQIETINDEYSSYVTQDNNTITVKVSNFVGEYITMIVDGPDGIMEVTSETDVITTTVNTEGEYTLELTQTNEYQKTSVPISATYIYIKE